MRNFDFKLNICDIFIPVFKEDTKLKPWIIAIIVICCVLGAAGIGFGIYFIIKKTKKMQVSEPHANRVEKSNIQLANNNVEPSSENRVSQFKNEFNKCIY